MGLENIFNQWESNGIFAYGFPFLLIFALIFGLLTKLNIFATKEGTSNKGINVMIALAIAFMSLQFNLVSSFFGSLFPRFGIALAIILIILIFTGLFTDPKSNITKWVLYGVIFVSIIAILWIP
jgi:hypothetical protein